MRSGDTEQRQILMISQLCGSMEPSVWEGVDKLPLYHKMEIPAGYKRRVAERLSKFMGDPSAIQLIDALLTLDPKLRIGTEKHAQTHV